VWPKVIVSARGILARFASNRVTSHAASVGFTTGSNSGYNSGPQASPHNARPIWARRLGATLGDPSCTSLRIENQHRQGARARWWTVIRYRADRSIRGRETRERPIVVIGRHLGQPQHHPRHIECALPSDLTPPPPTGQRLSAREDPSGCGSERSPAHRRMCSATLLNCRSYPGSIDISSGTLGLNSSAAGERRIWPSELRRRCSP